MATRPARVNGVDGDRARPHSGLMLRLRWLVFTRLLPFIGPLLLERDLLLAQRLATELEIEVLRAQLRRARAPVVL